MEDPDTVFNNINDEGFNTVYINFNITNGEYGTIDQFFNGIYDESGNKLVPGFMELASDNVNEMEESEYITNVKDLLSQNGITPTSSSTPVTDQEELDQLVSGATEAPEVEEPESSGGILDFAEVFKWYRLCIHVHYKINSSNNSKWNWKDNIYNRSINYWN